MSTGISAIQVATIVGVIVTKIFGTRNLIPKRVASLANKPKESCRPSNAVASLDKEQKLTWSLVVFVFPPKVSNQHINFT